MANQITSYVGSVRMRAAGTSIGFTEEWRRAHVRQRIAPSRQRTAQLRKCLGSALALRKHPAKISGVLID